MHVPTAQNRMVSDAAALRAPPGVPFDGQSEFVPQKEVNLVTHFSGLLL
jgi:hypothetical protein